MRGLADLGVELAVVLVLDPGLRRLVEERPSVRSGTCSSMAISRPSTGPQNASCLAF